MIVSTKPVKQDWKPTEIKGDRYAIYRNSDGLLTVFFDGKKLPRQKDLVWRQNMNDAVEITVTFLME